MKKNAFLSCHPLVNLVYFLSVIGFSCFFIHPACLGISFVCATVWAFFLLGGKRLSKSLWVLLPVIVVTMVMNPLFNHQGITTIGYLPGGNPLALESVLYGLLAGVMVASLLVWFLCFGDIMRDDKIAYLFGRIAPSLGLVFSMTLRFVPRFLEQFKKVHQARGRMRKSGGRIREAMAELSGVTTWALENSVDTADSMKARGYGLSGRTAYYPVRFALRDGVSLLWLFLMDALVLIGGWSGQLKFLCFPQIVWKGISWGTLPYLLGFFLLCSYPLLLEFWEVRRWNSMKSGD